MIRRGIIENLSPPGFRVSGAGRSELWGQALKALSGQGYVCRHTYVYIYIFFLLVHICTHLYVCVCVYIYRERERESSGEIAIRRREH